MYQVMIGQYSIEILVCHYINIGIQPAAVHTADEAEIVINVQRAESKNLQPHEIGVQIKFFQMSAGWFSFCVLSRSTTGWSIFPGKCNYKRFGCRQPVDLFPKGPNCSNMVLQIKSIQFKVSIFTHLMIKLIWLAKRVSSASLKCGCCCVWKRLHRVQQVRVRNVIFSVS